MEEMTYEGASKELEEIVAKLENGKTAMKEASEMFARGQELIKFCYTQLGEAKGKLTEVKENLGSLTEE